MKKLLLSYIMTSTASWMFSFLIPLTFLKITNSALYVTVAYATAFLPYIFITPFSGVMSDRLNKKKLLFCGELLCAASVFFIIIIGIRDQTLPLILLLTFIASSAITTHHPAFQSIIPVCVPKDKIKKFNATVNATDNIVSILAPLGAGLLLGVVRYDHALIACLVLYIFSFFLITLIPYAYEKHESTGNNIFSLIFDGFKYVLHDPIIRSACILFVCVNFGIRIFYANIFYIFDKSFGLDESALGPFFAIMGIGAVAGSALAPKIIETFRYGTIITWSSLMIGLISGLSGLIPDPYFIAIAWGISSAFQSLIVVSFFTLRQKIVPPDILGRAVAVSRLLAYMAIPIAAVTGGFILEKGYSYQVLLFLSGASIITAAFVCFASPLYKDQNIS